MIPSSDRIQAVKSSGLLDARGQAEFNDIVELVKAGVRCPVAVVSILDADRQVFIAHLGLPGQWAERGETPLTHSFCQYVVNDAQPLVVDDATLHDLVKDNLAIPDLGVISYMGVPIALPDGTIIGALAAIDGEPRQWTPAELDVLKKVGKVACNQIETFVSERRWGRLFEQLEEGIVVGSLIRDDAGHVTDWRIETVNTAWARMAGVTVETAPGLTVLQLFPDAESDWISDVVEAVESGEVRRFSRRFAMCGHWYEGYIQPTGLDRFLIAAIEVTDRMRAIDALAENEARMRLIVEGAKDYIIVTLDEAGIITNWFGGATETLGWTEAEMVGQPFAMIFTEEDRAAGVPEMEIAKAAADGVASDRRWHKAADGTTIFLDGTLRPLSSNGAVRAPGFIKMARNATAQKMAEDRQTALLALGDRIRELDAVTDVAAAAAEIMACSLQGATRAGYGIVDQQRETVQMLPDWRAEGMFTVAGLHHFRTYGSYIEDLKRGEIIIIPDVATDPRTAGSAALLRSLGISVLVNVPIMEHGAFVGVMFVHYDKPHDFNLEERDFVRTIADRTREAISRIRAEEEQQMLNHEISHRLKNSLAMVQAIATQTLRPVTDRAPVEAFTSRLQALSQAHQVLLSQDWSSARMMAVITSVLDQVAPPDRHHIDGDDIEIGPRAALSLALVLHELATNALKYGAWSNADGRIALAWRMEGTEDDKTMVLTWREDGGPAVTPPSTKGFGSRLIRTGLTGSGGVAVDYRPEGLLVEMRGLLSQLRQS